jgi:hypothetical protein
VNNDQVITGLLAVVLAVLSSSVVVAIINRRQVKADAKRLLSEAGLNDANAAKILTDTATALLSPALRRLGAAEKRITELEKERAQYRRLFRAHNVWDRQAVLKLAAAGIQLPDPPSLDDVA